MQALSSSECLKSLLLASTGAFRRALGKSLPPAAAPSPANSGNVALEMRLQFHENEARGTPGPSVPASHDRAPRFFRHCLLFSAARSWGCFTKARIWGHPLVCTVFATVCSLLCLSALHPVSLKMATLMLTLFCPRRPQRLGLRSKRELE